MSYQLLTKTVRKARKEHACIWCPENIKPGEPYVDERSVADGFQFHRWHPECWEASQNWFRETGEEDFSAHECKRGTCEAK